MEFSSEATMREKIMKHYLNNPFFRNNEVQTLKPVAGKIINGKIPKWLEGSLLRNGPGIQKVGNYHYQNVFDGLAILHKFTFKDGRAFYQSRHLESETYKRNFAASRIVVSELGTVAFPDPCQSIFGRLQSTFTSLLGTNKDEMEMTDNCSVNVAFYGDQLYAMTETVFIRRIHTETLKPIGEKTRIGDYCVLNTATAHPHCMDDGTIINAGTNFRNMSGPHYCFVKIPPSYGKDETVYKDVQVIAEIPCRWKLNPSYFHSFGITENYIVFLEMPLCIDIISAVTQKFHKKPYLDCMNWFSNTTTRIHIISIADGKSHDIIFEATDLFVLHHVNAYEHDGCLIFDACCYNNADVIFILSQLITKATTTTDLTVKGLQISDLVRGASVRRFVVPLNVNFQKYEIGENLVKIKGTTATAILKEKSNSLSSVRLTPHHLTKYLLDLPRINEKYNGKKYQFFYGLGGTEKAKSAVPVGEKITKVNVADGTIIDFFIDGASEPVFVPNPTSPNPAEDDGIILSVILHEEDLQDVSLLILNAKDMTEVSRIKFKADGAVTSTFHGIWTSINDNKNNNTFHDSCNKL